MRWGEDARLHGRFQLGSDKARSVQARFLIAPVENRTYRRVGHQRVALKGTFPMALPKSGGLPLLTRLQNRACAFPFTRLLSGAAPVMSTIQPTGLGDALSALHTCLGQAGFMSYACLLAPLPSTPPLPRQRILGITPGLGFLGDPTSGPGMRLTTCSRKPCRESRSEVTPFLLGVGLSP
jgi:hypothetical protein